MTRIFADHMDVRDTPALRGTLIDAIRSFGPKHVLETGTHKGDGSTRVFLRALEGYSGIESFRTIEVNREYFEQACLNLRGTMVECLCGLTVTKEAALEALKDSWLSNLPEGIAQDSLQENGRNHDYTSEIHGGAPGSEARESILESLLPLERPFICLDSAGGMGLLEFHEVVRLQSAPFLLYLDDINHVKHWRSRLEIEADPVSWKVHGVSMTEGWLIAEKFV